MSSSALQDLLAILDLEPLEVNLFRGRSPQSRWQRVFGGQVIGQALVAACRTVEDVAVRPPHSLHAYFLLGGDPKVADHLRGRSHPRRPKLHHPARGRDPAWPSDLFDVGLVPSARGRIDASVADADVPKPDAAAERDRDQGAHCCRNARPGAPLLSSASGRSSCGPVEYDRYLGQKLEGGRFHVWIRATGRLPDEPAIHQCVLAYASDMMLARRSADPARHAPCSRRHHGGEPRSCAVVSSARSAPTNGCSTCRTARTCAGARGFSRGSIFTSDGTLVASVAQEGLLRQRRPKPE